MCIRDRSRVTNDVDTVSQNLNQGLIQIVTSITTLLGILVMMLTISGLLTLVAVIILPISFLLIMTIVKKSQKLFKRHQDALGEVNGHIEEMYGGHSVVKVFNGEERSLKKFNGINTHLHDSGWKSQFLSGLLFPIINIVGNVGYVSIAVLGGKLAIQGSINIGDIQAFIQYMSQFTQPITQVANVTNILQSTAAAAERIFEFLDEKEEVKDVRNPVVLKKIKGDIEFNNVVFGYEKGKTIIKNFNAKVKAGQQIAIVGPTGAGKTTMVNLLMRFYDLDSGSIKIDGVDIKDMRRSDVRRMFGMVLPVSYTHLYNTAPSMTWIMGVAVAILLAVIMIVFAIATPKFKLVQKLVDKLNLVTRQNLTGLRVIRAFNTEKYEEKRFDKANRDLTSINPVSYTHLLQRSYPKRYP